MIGPKNMYEKIVPQHYGTAATSEQQRRCSSAAAREQQRHYASAAACEQLILTVLAFFRSSKPRQPCFFLHTSLVNPSTEIERPQQPMGDDVLCPKRLSFTPSLTPTISSSPPSHPTPFFLFSHDPFPL